MKGILKHTKAAALLLGGIVGLTSCISDNGVCPDSPDGNDPATPMEVNLRFTLSTTPRDTRASSANHDKETEQAGTSAENFIDLDQLQMMLFDGQQRFLQNLHPVGTPVKNNDGSYDVVVNIKDKYFMDNIKSPGIPFYILALANGPSMGSPWLNAFREETTIEDLCRQMQSTTMTVKPDTYKLLKAGEPDPTFTPQYIPMSGIQYYSVPGNDLAGSTEDNPYVLTQDLNLLRAMAKIEIIDKINYTGRFTDALAESPDRIDKVSIAGHVDMGNLLPLYDQWKGTGITMATQQLTAPCLPADAGYVNPPLFDKDYNKIVGSISDNMLLNFERTAPRAEDNAPVFTCYVYEFQNPATGTSINVTQPPYFNISVKGKQTGGGGSQVYPLRLALYTDGEATDNDYLTELVRNHIYRYEITGIENFKALVTLTVSDWNQVVTNWEYSENIGIANNGSISWIDGTYDYLDQSAASVTLKQNLEAAKCSFTIAQPVNATWRAVFVPIGDTPIDAFAFRLADGSTASSVEGTIDGSQANLEIVPTNAAPPHNYSARLQVIVTLADGRSMNADVCNGQYGQNKFFTIRQNAQL